MQFQEKKYLIRRNAVKKTEFIMKNEKNQYVKKEKIIMKFMLIPS